MGAILINRVQRYFFNALLLSVSSIVLNAISVGFGIYISNKIGAEATGLTTLCGGVYGFAITLATSGVNLAVVKLVSASLPYGTSCDEDRKRVKGIMKKALLYSLFFSSASTVLLFFLAFPIGKLFIGDLRVVPSIKVLSLTLIPISISSVLNGYFSATRKIYKSVVSRFLEQGVKIGTTSFLLLLLAPSGVEYACVAISLGGVVSEVFSLIVNAIMYISEKKGEKAKIKKSENETLPSVFAFAFPIGVSGYVRSALSMIEHLLIPWGLKKSGKSASASLVSYGILHGMVIPILFFPSSVLGAFSSLLMPEISEANEKKDFIKIRKIISQVLHFTLVFAFFVSGILICYSYEIGSIFFSSDESSLFILLLSPLIPLMYLDGAVDSILKGLGEQIYTMRVNIFDSLVSVGLILLLLPPFGIYGYVAVIYVTELLNASFSILRLLTVSGVKFKILKWVFKPLLCIVLSTTISRLIFLFPLSTLPAKGFVVLEILVASVMYVILTVIVGSITKKDLHFLTILTKKEKRGKI